MVEILMQRQGNVLLPVAAPDQRDLILLPERRILTIEANAKAPLRIQRWFHAMLQLLVEATGRWPSVREAKKEILVRAGFFESFAVSADGEVRYTEQSTAEWGLVEWRIALDRIVPFVIENYVGETRAQFRDRVDRFLGIKMREAWEG